MKKIGIVCYITFMAVITQVNAQQYYFLQTDAYSSSSTGGITVYTTTGTQKLVEEKMANYAKSTDVYTKDEIDNAGYIKASEISQAGFATKDDLSAKQATLSTEQLAAANSGITQTGVAQIETNKTAIADLKTALDTKAGAADVTALDGKVSTNETNIKTNTSNISALDGKVSTNETNIETNTSNISALDGKVSTNKTNIETNTSNISALDGKVSTNETNIATNATNISNLQASVSSNGANLYKLENQVWSLSEDYRQLKRDFNTGRASMAAMTALVPNARASGDTQLSIGTGAYNGHTAIAIGGFHWVNNDVLLNAGVAWGNSQDAVYKAGVTLSW
ncbi:MAG: YadA-like family protein [Alphaproteobacteria bacterium]|nr:YadA-like family protein [Alphaproteobacteria bacterium]